MSTTTSQRGAAPHRDHVGLRQGAALACLALPTPTLPPATTTNHYLVGETQAVLVDPATPLERPRQELLKWLDRAQVRLSALFLTHHHRDHIGAAVFLGDQLQLPIWAHAETARLLQGEVPIARHMEDGEVVARDADGSPWTALFTPGHAPGHLALWHAQSGTAVAGDLVAGHGTILIDPSDGDMGLYLASLQRLADLAPATLAPAHGPLLTDAVGVLAHYRAHRLQRESLVLNALPTTWTDPVDLLPTAYRDTDRAAWPLAVRAMRSHLLHLAQQSLVQQRGELWRRLPR